MGYEDELKRAQDLQAKGIYNGVSPHEVMRKYGKVPEQTTQQKYDQINKYQKWEQDNINSGKYDNPDYRRQWLSPNERKLYDQQGRAGLLDLYSQDPSKPSKYDDWNAYFSGKDAQNKSTNTDSAYSNESVSGVRSSYAPTQRPTLSYTEASDRVKQQLDPLYQRALENVRKEKYQNELNASEISSKRGLSHSGLAADQLNKIAIASQSNISDLDAQRASQIAQMAQAMVERDQDMALRERGQNLSEYLGIGNLNLNRDQFDWNKSTDTRNFDYQKALNDRNFQYQQGRDKVSDAQWESVQKDSRAWREYEYNHMSAAQKAQLEWAKQQYGEDAAWKLYELQYNGELQKSMNQSELDYYKNAGFNEAPEGGGYNNNYKTQQQSSKSSTFSTYQKHLAAAVQSGGVPASWAPALTELVGRESSWNPGAKNPTSTAFGYGQFLKSTRDAYQKKTGLSYNDPVNQLVMMAQYVKDRYGTPEKALAFWDKNNWY